VLVSVVLMASFPAAASDLRRYYASGRVRLEIALQREAPPQMTGEYLDMRFLEHAFVAARNVVDVEAALDESAPSGLQVPVASTRPLA